MALEASIQSGLGTSIDFFIAQNNTDAKSINDFNWKPISPDNFSGKTSSSYVDFNGSTLDYISIVERSNLPSSQKNVEFYSTNAFTDIPGFEGIQLYKIAKLNSEKNYIEPIILEGTNRYKWYRIPYTEGISKDISKWKNDILSGNNNSVRIIEADNEVSNSSSFWTAPGFDDGASVLINMDILCPEEISIEKTLLKLDQNSLLWNVGVYLNGKLIRYIQSGVAQDSVLWKFNKGINNVMIAIDAAPKITGSNYGGLYGSFSLMEQSRVNQYGYVYQKYISYINPFTLRQNNSILNDTFTIVEIDTEKFIVSNKKLLLNSRMYYYTNNDNGVNSIRVKAELKRNRTNSKSSPVITSYRLKFKRSQTIADSVGLESLQAILD